VYIGECATSDYAIIEFGDNPCDVLPALMTLAQDCDGIAGPGFSDGLEDRQRAIAGLADFSPLICRHCHDSLTHGRPDRGRIL
jgi:hypothetical protein